MSSSFVKEAFRGQNRFLLRIAIIAALGGFLFGYDTGIISGAQLYIQRDLSTTQLEQQWIVGALLVGAIIGAAVAGWLSDRIGRRWTTFGSGCVYVGAGLLADDQRDLPGRGAQPGDEHRDGRQLGGELPGLVLLPPAGRRDRPTRDLLAVRRPRDPVVRLLRGRSAAT